MSIIKRSIGAWLTRTLAVAVIMLCVGSMSQTASAQAIGGLGGSSADLPRCNTRHAQR